MDFVVETGAGLADATSYITEQFLIDWAIANGLEIGSGDPKAAATAGSLWLDATYGSRYPGTRKLGRAQGLGWPRVGGSDREGAAIPDDAVPIEIKRAAAAAGLREMQAAGSLAPDVPAGGAVKREKLGPMEVEYAAADGKQTAAPRFPAIDGLLSGLLTWGGSMVAVLRA